MPNLRKWSIMKSSSNKIMNSNQVTLLILPMKKIQTFDKLGKNDLPFLSIILFSSILSIEIMMLSVWSNFKQLVHNP